VDGEPKETKEISAPQKRRGAQRRRHSGGRQAIHQIEMERQRLGRELHTEVGQMLAAIHLQVEVISAELPSPPPNVGRALASISTLAADSLAQVRNISRRLHPPEWQRLTLDSAIRQLWDISGIPQRFEASLAIHPLPVEPSLEAKILIYRGLQEALSNLVRHSHATRVAVALELSGGQLVLSVGDNGVGFDAQQAFSAPPSLASGIGLRSIRETAQELGGNLEVKSGADGTKLVVSVAPFPVESLTPS
jgi:two-component system NarL family sensor kinase